MSFRPTSQISAEILEEKAPVEVWPGLSNQEKELVIRAVYRQVLGNTYVMENQRLTVAESLFKRGELSVKEFVRQVAKSELYRSLFYESCSTFRSVELNFKHLLGRAPANYEEMKTHTNLSNIKGFEAEIDSYIDSDEYAEAYGDDIVPYYRGYKSQPGKNVLGFTYMCALRSDASSSDLMRNNDADKASILSKYAIQEAPAAVVWGFQDTPMSSRSRFRTRSTGADKVYRIEVTSYPDRKSLNRIPKYRSNNKSYLVPFDQLSEEYQRLHKQGCKILSITAVN